MEVVESVQRKPPGGKMPHKKLTAEDRERMDHLIQTDPYFALVAAGQKRIEAIPDYLDAMACIHHYVPKIYRQLTDGAFEQVLQAIASEVPIPQFIEVIEKWVALYERKIEVTRKHILKRVKR